MAETIACPGCQTKLKLRPEYAGKKIRCPRCAHLIAVPRNPAAVGAGKPAKPAAPARAVTTKSPARAAAAPPPPPPDPLEEAVTREKAKPRTHRGEKDAVT